MANGSILFPQNNAPIVLDENGNPIPIELQQQRQLPMNNATQIQQQIAQLPNQPPPGAAPTGTPYQGQQVGYQAPQSPAPGNFANMPGAPEPPQYLNDLRQAVLNAPGQQQQIVERPQIATQTERTVVTPEYRQALAAQQASAQQTLGAAGDLAEARTQASQQRADFQTQAANRIETQAIQDQAFMAMANDAVARKGELADQALAEYQAAAKKGIEPDRLMKGGRGVLSALAIALGELGAGLQRMGGIQANNQALTIINQAIDRDIDAQKSNLAQKQENVTLSNQIVQRARAIWSDQQAQRLAARADLREIIMAQGMALAERNNIPVEQAQQRLGLAQLQQQNDADRTSAARLELAHQTTTFQKSSQVVRTGMSLEDRVKALQGVDTLEKSAAERDGGGKATDETYSKVNEQVSKTLSMRGKIAELKNYLTSTNAAQRFAGRQMGNTGDARMDSLWRSLITDAVTAASGAAYSDKQEQSFNAQFGADKWTTSAALGNLDAMEQSITGNVRNRLGELSGTQRAQLIRNRVSSGAKTEDLMQILSGQQNNQPLPWAPTGSR